jgi:uncharacterized caspase-like protein
MYINHKKNLDLMHVSKRFIMYMVTSIYIKILNARLTKSSSLYVTILYAVLMCIIVSSFTIACAPSYRSVDYDIKINKKIKSTRICMPQQKSERWAVVVGIDDYQDPRISSLKGASHDAWSFYHYLASRNGGNIPASHRIILLNWQATRANLEYAFGQFLTRACPQDSIYIYFAGHGTPEPQRANEAFLLTHDTQLDNLVGTAISMRQLPRFLSWRAGQTGQLMMFVDACHAGQLQFPGQRGIVMDEQEDEQGFITERSNSVHKQIHSLSEAEPNWNLFAAASAKQVAVEARTQCPYSKWDYQGGLFTCSLLQALSGSADINQDGQLKAKELYQFVTHQVDKQTKGAQRPQWSGQQLQAEAEAEAEEQSGPHKPQSSHGMTMNLPTIKGLIRVPSIPSYLIKKPRSGPSPIAWSMIGSTLVSAGFTGYLVDQTNQHAADVATNLNGISSYEVDQQYRSRYNDSKTQSYIAMGITGGFALTSLGIWAYDYWSQRKSGKKIWFTIAPTKQTAFQIAKKQPTHAAFKSKE